MPYNTMLRDDEPQVFLFEIGTTVNPKLKIENVSNIEFADILKKVSTNLSIVDNLEIFACLYFRLCFSP